MSHHLYIVFEYQDHGFYGEDKVIQKIFTTRASLDTFMLSQTWKLGGLLSKPHMYHIYEARIVIFADDGSIIHDQVIDYSEHAPAPPVPEELK